MRHTYVWFDYVKVEHLDFDVGANVEYELRLDAI